MDCKGLVIIYSAKSNKDALEYLSKDIALDVGYLSKSKKTDSDSNLIPYSNTVFAQMSLCPMNVQDVSGMHHVTARSFGQLSELDAIHFMDPEDYLMDSLNLPEDEVTNNLVKKKP